MCNFFSFTTDPVYHPGQRFYFDWNYRKNHLDEDCDSHSFIAEHFGLDEDVCNKYEYNPLMGKFTVDQINSADDDQLIVEEWARQVNFSRIVEPLIVKPIVYPFSLPRKEITRDEILLLKEWDTVWATVWDTVWATVWDTVRDTVWATVRDTVWATVGATVWATVRATVRATVWATVRDTVWAYSSSFLNIEYEYNFSSCIKLWEMGIVPSFDGEIWRLHSGERAEVVFEISKEDLENYE